MNELGNTDFSNKALKQLLMPLIIEQALAITVGLADSIMVASVGEAAVSAVSLVDSINILLFNTFTALATGGAVVCGQFLGRKQLERANQSADQLFILMVLIAVTITAALYACKYFILHGLFGKIDADVMAYANTYFLIVEGSTPFMALYTAGAALFRVMGNSAISMRISICMNIINLSGNAFLIFVLHRGVEGVAIPTACSRLFGAVAVILLLRKQDKYLIHLSKPFRFAPEKNTIRNILRIGVPSGLESSLFQLGKILLLSVVSSLGTASIAANAIGNNLANFQIVTGVAIGTGLITVVSQCVGARDFEKARAYTKKLMVWAYVSMLILNIVIFLLQPLIIDLYHVSDETARYANIILWLHGGLGILIWPLAFTLPQALKAAGDTTFVMLVAVGSMWTFRIFTGILFARTLGYGVLGIWYAMFIDWVCRLIFFLIRWRGNKWEEKYVK